MKRMERREEERNDGGKGRTEEREEERRQWSVRFSPLISTQAVKT